MLILARNELYRLFLSPLAWVILALSQIITAYSFLTAIDYFMQVQPKISAMPAMPGVTELIVMPLLANTSTLFLLLAPLITMRLIAEERSNNSLPLLLSAPFSIRQIVLGKYLGTLAFFIVLLFMVSLMPLSLTMGSELDFGLFTAGILGLILLIASFIAIGLFLSSLTKQPAIAAISTFSGLFLLWVIDWTANSDLFSWLSIIHHYNPFLEGMVNSSDISYFLLIIIAFLALTIRKLDTERLS